MQKFILAFAFVASLAVPAFAADDEAQPVNADGVIQYVDDVVAWYRNIPTLDPLASNAREMGIKDNIHQNGDRIVRLSLDYAKAQNALLAAPTATKPQVADNASQAGKPDIAKLIVDNANRITALQNQLNNQTRDSKKLSGAQRRTMIARRDKTQSELNLALAQRDLLTTVAGFFTTTKQDNTTDGLPGKIAELTKLVPDLDATQQQKSNTKVVVEAAPATAEVKEQEVPDNGVFSLTGRLLDMMRERTRLLDISRQTNALHDANQSHMNSLRAQLRAASNRGNELGAQSTVTDPAQLAQQQAELNGLVTRFKLLSAATAPLAEQSIWLESAQRNLSNWSRQLDSDVSTTLQSLIFRLVLLAIAITIPLGLASFAKRATQRYVKDERRQRQLRILRRIILGVMIVVIISLNFFSEFGSLATYAGLITAGIAVALQNVILSMVAHFFFFGRFGVRVGDRVTVNSVTGDIIEIGVLRFYLMELDSESSSPHPTGRVVAFPNSILFQQSAFFKQIPGTHYTWRAVTVSLPTGIDYAAAQEKLLAAVNSVYASYRADMETQQSILEHSTRLKVRLPKPESNLKFAGSAISFEARYPVEMGRSSEIDDKVTQELLKVIQSGQDQLSGSGAPEVKPA